MITLSVTDLVHRTVAKILKKAGFFIFETLPQASVPISKFPLVLLFCPLLIYAPSVKFMDNRTGHRVDLNINDRLGVLNSDLIKRYCELNPVLVPMIQYVKLWAKPLGLNSPSRNQLNKPMTFSSYALVMMTIGFLQVGLVLPVLQCGSDEVTGLAPWVITESPGRPAAP